MRSRHGTPSQPSAPKMQGQPQHPRADDEAEEVLVAPEHIRAGLQVALAAFTAYELSFWWQSRLMSCTLLLTNGWGWLDAVWRFPKPPRADSFFTRKQVALLLAKLALMALSFKHVDFEPLSLIGLLFWNLVCPLVYLLLLPAGHHSRAHAEDSEVDEVDEDAGFRAFQFAFSPRCQRAWLKRSVATLRAAGPPARLRRLVCDLSPLTRSSPKHKSRRVV